MTTHTRTHISTSFANPYLICSLCRQTATGFHQGDPSACGCETGDWLVPCHHAAEAIDICWSWSPADGCQCPNGTADHASHTPAA
ncbi:hypothetical protein ACH4MJ_04305 [Streptomyces anulatus]